MELSHWATLALGVIAGGAFVATTLVPYVWKSRYQEGAHDMHTGKLKL